MAKALFEFGEHPPGSEIRGLQLKSMDTKCHTPEWMIYVVINRTQQSERKVSWMRSSSLSFQEC
jgi:hypothetical protein